MIRRTTLAAAAVIALVLGSSPASAACPPTWSTRLPCADGDIAERWLDEDGLTRLSGWIDPCGTPRARERFGFIYYVQQQDPPGPRGYAFPTRLREYGPGRTAFEGTVDPSVEPLNGPLIGVCLAYGPGKVIDCVQPLREPDEGGVRPPLPPIEVIATLPFVFEVPGGVDPNCATCV